MFVFDGCHWSDLNESIRSALESYVISVKAWDASVLVYPSYRVLITRPMDLRVCVHIPAPRSRSHEEDVRRPPSLGLLLPSGSNRVISGERIDIGFGARGEHPEHIGFTGHYWSHATC